MSVKELLDSNRGSIFKALKEKKRKMTLKIVFKAFSARLLPKNEMNLSPHMHTHVRGLGKDGNKVAKK